MTRGQFQQEGEAQVAAGRSTFLSFLSFLSVLSSPGTGRAASPGDWPGWRGLEREGRAAPGNYPTHWSPDPSQAPGARNIRWKTPIPGKGHSSPIVVGDKVFLTTAYFTGRGESLKKAASLAVIAATGLLALLAAAVALRSLRPPLALARVIATASACLLVVALVLLSLAVFLQYERGEVNTERRMELWLLSSVAASLCLALAAFGRRRARLAAGLAALLFAALVILGRPEPRYFDLTTPGRYTGEIRLAAGFAVAIGLALVAAHAAGLWRTRALLPNWLAIAFVGIGALGFAERNYLLRTKEFVRAIVCLDKETGAVKWTREGLQGPQPVLNRRNSPATPTPAADGERVYAWFGSAGAICTNPDGKVLWTNTDLPFECVHGAGPSLLLSDGLLVVTGTQVDAPYLAALDSKTGQRVWTATLHPWPGIEGQHRAPTIVSAKQDLLLLWGWEGAEKEDALRAYDVRSGEALWKHPLKAHNEAVASIISDGDAIFLTNSHEAHALSIGKLSRGESFILWTTPMKMQGPHVASPVLCRGMLFTVSNKGRASCLDAKTGRVLWQEQVARQVSRGGCMASPVAAGNAVYFPDVSGRTTVVAAEPKFRRIAENDLGEPIWASPAPVGGRLYVRTTGHLWCIEEKP